MPGYKLWLDDFRPPPDSSWQWCQSVAQAVDVVQLFGFPDAIAFDHDLGPDAPTGHDFAKWLIERDLDMGGMPADFAFTVHSANPVGAENIGRLMSRLSHHRCRTSQWRMVGSPRRSLPQAKR
jgi:hypothetical protein